LTEGTTRLYQNDPQDATSLSDDSVSTIFEDRDGNLWVGTLNGGLNRFERDAERFTRFVRDPDDVQTLSSNTVLDIYHARDGALWVGTAGGLNRFDARAGTFVAYREKDGLPNNFVYGILEDGQGYLWLSTNKGLSRFDPRTETFKNYDASDGLQGDEFNQWSRYQNDEGVMFFGGLSGLNVFHPDLVQDNPFVPPVVLTDFEIYHRPVTVGPDSPLRQPIEVTREIELAYTDGFFELTYAALHFSSPEEIEYAYVMENLDPDWSYVGNRRFATYTNVPPGEYVFRVKAANPDGVWNESGTALSISVAPPIWDTWWFRLLAGVFVAGAVAGSYRLRVRSVEKRARVLEGQVASRTEELSALNAIGIVVSASLDLEQILSGALDKTLDVTRHEAGGIYLVQRNSTADPGEEGRLKLVAHKGIDASLLAAIDDLAVGEGFSGHVVQTGEPLLVADLSADDRLTRTAVKEQGYRALAIAPLISRGKVLGTLFVMTSSGLPQAEQDVELLTSIAGQVAVAVENARLYASEQQRTTELARALEQQQELDRLKDEFIRNVSHELRTPLALVLGYAELLADGVMDEPAPGQVEPLRIIVDRCRKLTTLVEDITTIVENRGPEPRDKAVSLREEVEAALADFRVMAEHSELGLEVQIPAQVPPVLGDRHQLRTVVDNLLDNAIKFTPAGGVITVSLYAPEGDPPGSPGAGAGGAPLGEVVLCVADTGIGIAPQHHKQIFDRFFQVDGSLRRTYGGSGLGLALVKEIVEAHRGSVQVESDLGQGSAFTVRLPAAGLAE